MFRNVLRVGAAIAPLSIEVQLKSQFLLQPLQVDPGRDATMLAPTVWTSLEVVTRWRVSA